MSLKILIIQGTIPPYRIPFFEELGKVYDVTVLFFRGNPPPGGLKAIKFDGGVYKVNHMHITPGVYSIARNYDCVIIMFDLWWLNLSLLPFMLGNGDTRVILWGHGIGRTNGFKLATYLRRLIAAKARAIIFYTQETKEFFLQKVSISADKCFVANNTILVKQPPVPEAANGRSYFIYLGRIQPRKRLDQLIRAYMQLSDEVKNAYQLLIIGDGEPNEKAALRRLVALLKLSGNVLFEPGTFNEDTIAARYSGALAYVSPGAVGLGVVQSFAHGVPVITPGNILHGPEFAYCDEANSFLYSRIVDDEPATILRLRDAMSAAVDPAVWERRSAAAYETYRSKCSINNMVAGFSAAIEYSCNSV